MTWYFTYHRMYLNSIQCQYQYTQGACASTVLSVCAKMLEMCKRPVCKPPLFVPSSVFVALWNVHLRTHRLSFNNVPFALPSLSLSFSLALSPFSAPCLSRSYLQHLCPFIPSCLHCCFISWLVFVPAINTQATSSLYT